MNRKILGFVVATVTLASAHLVEAQQPAKVFRIGYLSTALSERQKTRLAAFQQGLRDLGYGRKEHHH